MRSMLFAALTALTALCPGVVAHADDLFVYSNGLTTVTFTLPASPQSAGGSDPFVFSAAAFNFVGLPYTYNGPARDGLAVEFYGSADDGGFGFDSPIGIGGGGSGAVMFSGPTDVPTFLPGTYTLYVQPDRPLTAEGTLTISAIPQVSEAPEPPGAALLATGLFGLACLLRHKARAAARQV